MSNRKICVVTGTRAEYGLLFWLMTEIKSDPDLDLQLVVTGAHLAPKFGETVTVIEDDGFAVDERIDLDLGDDMPVGVARSMGLGVIGFGEAFGRLQPDIVVVLGDRYEILACAEAAMIARIPIAHIHGGEVTEGAMDDAMRHAITKMAHLHFVATEPYRDRVIQMGEAPERVFTVGAPGLDNIDKLDLPDRASLGQELELPDNQEYFLVTYHPVTLSADDIGAEAEQMLAAFDQFPDIRIILTGVNADPGHDRISGLLSDYAAKNKARVSLHASLGQRRYLSAMQHAACVVGNSSSGIIEAPTVKTPTVNIGDRQKGRLRASSVIDCAGQTKDIAAAIGKALSPDFRAGLQSMTPPYGTGGASATIKDHLKSVDLTGLNQKSFHDMVPQRAVS